MAQRLMVVFLLVLVGCDEGEPPLDASMDAAVSTDAGPADAGSRADAGRDDGSAEDAATADASAADAAITDAAIADAAIADAAAADAAIADASSAPDAGGACHAHPFGATPVPIRMVASLPEMTGGTIPLGTYDAVDAQTTGTIGGMYRATWVFEDATTLAQLQQITLAGPGAVTPRLFTWSTAGTTLTRAETCPGADTFTQTYRVRTDGGDTLLDVRQATLMFTFRLR